MLEVGRACTVVLVVPVIGWPSRSNPMTASPPALSRISSRNCSQPVTSTPLKATITSPGSRPASMAGVGGSSGRQARPSSAYGSRHSETVSMTGGPAFGSIDRSP